MITATRDDDIIINTASPETSLEDIGLFLRGHLAEYADHHVLWDLTAINFYTITNTATKRFVRRHTAIGDERNGRRAAMLLNPEMGPGKVRSLQMIFDENKVTALKIFNERRTALDWLRG